MLSRLTTIGSHFAIPRTPILSRALASMAAAPLQLYSLATPNGVRVTTYLEELKAAYGLQYECAPPFAAGSRAPR
jgi:hypothetical protein